MSTRTSARVFNRIESFDNCKYPKFIKEILTECGFETEASLQIINEQSITEVENLINNSESLRKKLEATIYVKKDGTLKTIPFKFLLGHKLLILQIASTVSRYNIAKKTNQKTKTRALDTKNWQESLLNKFESYIKTKKLQYSVKANLFEASTITQNSAKVNVKCVQCDIVIPCTFKNYWNISNYVKHVATHKKSVEKSSTASSTRSTLQSSHLASHAIERANASSSNTVLNKVLG